MAVHGGCDCGAVRYVLSRESLPPVVCCHCLDCQTRSGSAFDQTGFVDPDELEVTGPLVSFAKKMPSGMDATDSTCGGCHTVIYNTHSARPATVLLRAGTLDDSQAIVPVAHIFAKRKQSWIGLPDDVPTFAEFPSGAEFFELLK
jgi:hypothetical protein